MAKTDNNTNPKKMKAKSAKWQQSAGLARFRPAPK